jgi:RNA polymerase sigma-70 factor (ECF subfamily)
MAAGLMRRSRARETKTPMVPGADGQAGAAAVDGLLRRVAHGDGEAFAEVCGQVSGAVYGLVSRIIADQSRAEQVAGEVLAEVWRSASHFRPAEGSGLTWVMTIARCRAMSDLRVAGNGHLAGLGHSGAARVAAERAAGSLLAHPGVASLPEAQREVLLLASCGYTWRQVADLAGISAVTVAEWLRDSLLVLSSRLE